MQDLKLRIIILQRAKNQPLNPKRADITNRFCLHARLTLWLTSHDWV